MKQTNNAIKFLMAQYRAIFKNAYLKGMASAAVLTLGLAAASAANATPSVQSLDGDKLGEKLDESIYITGSKYESQTGNNFTNISISGSTVSNFTGSINFNPTAEPSEDSITNSVIRGSGTLNINAPQIDEEGTRAVLHVMASGNGSSGDLGLQTINIKQGTLQLDAENSGALVVSSEFINVGTDAGSVDAVIQVGGDDNSNDTNSGSITLGKAQTDAFAGTKITLGKAGKIVLNGTSGGTGGNIEGASLIINGGKLQARVKDNTTSTLKTHKVEITDGTLEIHEKTSGDFTVDLDNRYFGADGKQVSGQFEAGTLTLNGGLFSVAATMNIAGGVVSVSDSTIMADVNTTDKSGGLVINAGLTNADITSALSEENKAVLSISSEKLNTFLNGGTVTVNGSAVTTAKSNVLLQSGGAIEFTDATDLATNIKIASGSAAADGQITVNGSGLIYGDNLAISKTIGENLQSGLLVKATNLTLGGGSEFDSASATSLGVKTMQAQNVVFKDDADGSTFTLKDKLVFVATQEIANPYDSTAKGLTYAGHGAIDGDVIIANATTATATQVQAGHYTSDNDITISGSTAKLTINNNNYTNIDSSLTLGSSSTLTLDAGAQFAVNGSKSTAINFGSAGSRQAEVYADISDAHLVAEGDATNKFIINGGSLIMDDAQLAYVLQADRDNSSSNVGIKLQGDATLIVEGNIQGLNNSGLDVSKIASGSAAQQGKISISGAGSVEATGNIWLAATNSSSKLNLGSQGTLSAESFRLDNNETIDSSSSNVRKFVVAAGTLEAGSSVTTSKVDHNSTLVLGDGTSGASLKLGYIDSNTDEWGLADHTYTTSAENGSVTQNLELAGSGSSLDVVYGTWTASDIALTGDSSSITVGTTERYYDPDGNELSFNAALNGKALSLSASKSALKINSNGAASFSTLNMSNGSISILGQMTVDGQYVAADDTTHTKASYGVDITGGTINVSGRNAQLTFGEDAASAISVNGDEVTTSSFTQNITVDDYATLRLDFAAGVEFTEAALKDLRQTLLANSTAGAALNDGYIHLGNASIKGLSVENGEVNWDNLSQFKDIKDIKVQGLDSATLVNVDETDTITANVGNIKANENTQTVNLSDTTLNSAAVLENGSKAFVTNENGDVLNVNVQDGAVVGLYNGGTLKNVNLASSTQVDGADTVLNIVASNGAETSFESINGGEGTVLNVDGKTIVNKNLAIGTLNLNQDLSVTGTTTVEEGLFSDEDNATPASLTTNKLYVKGDTEFLGNITTTDVARFDATSGRDHGISLGGNNVFKGGVEFKGGDVVLAYGSTQATDMALQAGTDMLIEGNANVYADNLTVEGNEAASTLIAVGEVAGREGNEQWDDSTGYLTTGNLDLNGATLIVDPDYDMAASIAVTDTLGNISSSYHYDGGNLQGSLVAARNSIIAVGVSDDVEHTAIEKVQSTFASLMASNGALKKDDIGSIIYFAKNVNIQNGSKLVVDSTKTRDEFLHDRSTLNNTTYAQSINDNDAYIGANSALAIDKAALNQSYDGVTQSAIHFDKDNASLYNAGGMIILTGDDFRTSDTINLFSDNGGDGNNGVLILGERLEVSTLNGLLHFYLEANEQSTGKNLELNYDQVDYVFNDASAPVKYSLISYAAKDNLWDSSTESDVLHGERLDHVTFNGTSYVDADGNAVDATNLMHVANEDGTYTVYEKPNNYFLEQVVRGYSGRAAETVARLGVFGGVAQAAIAAGSSTYDAISGRMGVGANGSNITVADNTQGTALWLTPIYKNSDSDSFDAQGVDYGVDMDLYGVALGADYTLNNGLRIGAMFNMGSGDVDGQGAGSGVSNDFDYYGFGAYVGYTMGALNVVADLSYTVADNDLEGNTAIDKVGASLDSTNLSFGVTGAYQLDVNGFAITPHAGLRYSQIDIDDYTVDGEDIIANYNADSMNIFSIPVGVTFSKEFTGNAWTVKPSFDVTLTGNFGDDETDGTVYWAGVENLSTNVSSEVLDSFTYGATLGVAAKTGNFSLGLGLNYTGSSNTDEFGLQANARFVF